MPRFLRRRKTIGRTTWYNRQESVRMVICYRFGLTPSGLSDQCEHGLRHGGGDYRDSVRMIASVRPGSAFLSALRRELARLESAA
jgi:hypothetical protein